MCGIWIADVPCCLLRIARSRPLSCAGRLMFRKRLSVFGRLGGLLSPCDGGEVVQHGQGSERAHAARLYSWPRRSQDREWLVRGRGGVPSSLRSAVHQVPRAGAKEHHARRAERSCRGLSRGSGCAGDAAGRARLRVRAALAAAVARVEQMPAGGGPGAL
jgi:hypothetical protein